MTNGTRLGGFVWRQAQTPYTLKTFRRCFRCLQKVEETTKFAPELLKHLSRPFVDRMV